MKDDYVYLLNDANIFSKKDSRKLMDHVNEMDENIDKVLSLTYELLKKNKIIDSIKSIKEKMNNYL